MGKGRWALAITLWLLVAAMIVLTAFFVFRQSRERPEPQPPVPVEAPKAPSPVPVPPKSDAPVKPKDKIKPPKVPPPVAAVDDDIPGKVRLCPGNSERATIASDGRLLGHRPYADASASNLSSAPEGFNSGSCSQLNEEAKVALSALMDAARADDPAIADAMIGLSCFRSAKYQREVFCRKVADGFAVRARASAPPGHSEHATGYALDFGDKNVPECNLSACFATTPVGQWLASNASQHGFVLSFPQGNAQGVMYEPWHWRYQGSGAARAVFAGAD